MLDVLHITRFDFHLKAITRRLVQTEIFTLWLPHNVPSAGITREQFPSPPIEHHIPVQMFSKAPVCNI